MNKSKVIVVGGGAAGIAAATRLVLNGFQNVTVLEAENRLGGRCNTVSLGDECVDLGAQWIHGEKENVAYEIAAPLNLTKPSVVGHETLAHSRFIKPDGSILSPEVSTQLYCRCAEIVHSASESDLSTNRALSLGEVFITRFNKIAESLKEELNISDQDIEQFLEWFHKFENSIEACDSWFDVSFEGFLKYEDCEGNLNIAWESGGYSNIIDLLLQKIPKTKSEIQLNVLFGKEVTQIIRNQELSVKCADNSVYVADHVIVSTSLGVLKQNALSMFSPHLPYKKLQAINALEFGVAEKLFLQFPYRWWPEDTVSFNILLDSAMKEDLRQFGKEWLVDVFTFFTVDNAKTTLCGWAGRNSVRYISNLSDETVRDDLFFLLKMYLSTLYEIPAPSRFIRSNWFGNPHFRGAYSYVTVKANVSRLSSEDLAEPVVDKFGKPVLLFAGEATHSHFFSTVHGAIETGWREADRLIAFYKNVRYVDTVIVGAGLAGLGAAFHLQNKGQDFIVLEAQNYVGGRVKSAFEEGTFLELGAQWLHGTDNSLYHWAKTENLLSSEISHEGKGLYVCDDKSVIPQVVVEQVAEEIDSILKRLEDYSPFKEGNECPKKCPNLKSVGQFLRSEFEQSLKSFPEDNLKLAEQLLHWHNRFQIIDNACNSLEDLPIEEWGSYSLNGDQDNINLRNGYSSLVQAIFFWIEEARIKLNTEVKNIHWYGGSLSDHVRSSSYHIISSIITDEIMSKLSLTSNGCNRNKRLDFKELLRLKNSTYPREELYPVSILCEDGSQFLARHVIVTCSLGFLKKHHQDFFVPNLPPVHRSVIENTGFGAIDKIFLVFDQCWWNSSVEGFQLIWSQNTSTFLEEEIESSWIRDVTGFDVLSANPPVLLGWVGGPGAELMEELDEEKLAADCQKLLQRFLHERVPRPKKVFRSQWITNPFILGGYSHASVKCWKLNLRPSDLNKIIDFTAYSLIKHPVILFAGEANSEHDFSTTHGAYHSGVDQASIIVDYHKKLIDIRFNETLPFRMKHSCLKS